MSSRPSNVRPDPAFTLEKLQKIDGSEDDFSTAPLTAKVGQTIDYKVLVTNTGNVPLTLSSFGDPHCDAGTITGGPSGGVLAVGTSTAYLCKHTLRAADVAASPFTNTVMLTGTPPAGEGSPITQPSNTVVVEVLPDQEKEQKEKEQKEREEKDPKEKEQPERERTRTESTRKKPNRKKKKNRSGRRRNSSRARPRRPRPRRKRIRRAGASPRRRPPSPERRPRAACAPTFSASVKANGVGSVIFYLDGRRMKTAHLRRTRTTGCSSIGSTPPSDRSGPIT